MKKIYAFIGSLLFSVAALGATFQYFNPAAGILKGNPSTYITTAAVSSDILATFSGTCNSTTFMRGDGSCQTPPGAGGGTVNSVGLSAPSVFSVTGSPITNTGTLALAFATGQTANSFLATPDGTTGALSLRTIVLGDLPTITAAKGGTGVTTLTGIAKGNGTSAFTAAASSDVIATWSGTCSSSTFLRGDGSCQTPATGTGTVTSVALTVPSGFSVTGSPVTTSGTLAISGTLNPAAGGTGVATLTGIAKGNGTSAFTAAVSGDVISTWGGTCSASTYLRGDGTCQTPPTGGTSANPTATIGLTAVNGSAGTFLRSDGAPALSQAIAPTWTGVHTFQGSDLSGLNAPVVFKPASTGNTGYQFNNPNASANNRIWRVIGDTAGSYNISTIDDAGTTANLAFSASRSGAAVTSVALGNSTNKPSVATYGNVTVNTPSSGAALTVNGLTVANAPSSGPTITATAGTGNAAITVTAAASNDGIAISGGSSLAAIKFNTTSLATSIGNNESLSYGRIRNLNSSNDVFTWDASDRVAFPSASTTASAANAFLDNGNSNRLLRSTSSRRYKKDIIPLGYSLNDEVYKLKPVRYHSKAEADSKTDWFYGLIAEDVAEVEPRLVQYDAQGRPDGVQYDRVGVLLLGVVQEQQEQIKALREELDELKKKVH